MAKMPQVRIWERHLVVEKACPQGFQNSKLHHMFIVAEKSTRNATVSRTCSEQSTVHDSSYSVPPSLHSGGSARNDLVVA